MPNLTVKKSFSLRSLLLALTAASLLLGAWSVYVNPYRKQATSLALAHRLKGEVQSAAANGPRWHQWLVETMLGDGTFVDVTALNLSGCNVSDKDLHRLTGLGHIVELNLDHTPITDDGAAALASLHRLQRLSLRFTKVGDETAKYLAVLPDLNTVFLTSTQFTDASVDDLAKCANLRELYVRWSHISDAGAEKLRHALPECQVFNSSLVDDLADTH